MVRILLEEDANHDELAALLARRLDVEEAGPARIELHRALAEKRKHRKCSRVAAEQQRQDAKTEEERAQGIDLHEGVVCRIAERQTHIGREARRIGESAYGVDEHVYAHQRHEHGANP